MELTIGIDASNVRASGNLNHLQNILEHADPGRDGFRRIVVWSGRATLAKLVERPWLVKSHQLPCDGGLGQRVYWQWARLDDAARSQGCDVLFIPGGNYLGRFHPVVTMSQNMIPFMWSEIWRYRGSLNIVRELLLRWGFIRTIRYADGCIFLNEFARNHISTIIGGWRGQSVIIPHGKNPSFVREPRPQVSIREFGPQKPFRLIYVSIIESYKQQPAVAEAVAALKAEGVPIAIDFIGPKGDAWARFSRLLEKLDPQGEFLRYRGEVEHSELRRCYERADAAVFASSCETLPMILLEAMASGLPIACSNRGPMPETLGAGGVYFDPENPRDIARALRVLVNSPKVRAELARTAFERSGAYDWASCARKTFSFIELVARGKGEVRSVGV